MWNISNISSFINSMGYEFEDHLNFLVDLTKSKEEL
jgi:serine/alanine adding enzyme